jgi:DNA-binding NarL/FixJ family response regulator
MPDQPRLPTAPCPRQQKRKLRILIADDHELIRTGVRRLIESREDWEVCGESANGREVVALAETLQPDIVVLDLDMPELHGLEATRQIKASWPAIEVLIFTGSAGVETIHDAFELGVTSYISKNDIGDHLVSAIEALGEHKVFITDRISNMLLERYCRPEREAERLTPRERIVLQLLAEGKTNGDVAGLLQLNERTVEAHRAAVMRKLGLESFADLVRHAVREGLIVA